jgi:AcrR family transcriptional regulator
MMTKNEIIDTAFRVWGRDFYRKTSLSQLARELGVSKPALYRHFLNKRALMNAMTERFYDDFAAYIREDYERAEKLDDHFQGFLLVFRGIAGFFAHNAYALLFTLINHDHHISRRTVADSLTLRGLNMDFFRNIINSEYGFGSTVMQQVFATLNFFMAQFHIEAKSFENIPNEEEIQKIILTIVNIIEYGLCLNAADIDSLDLTRLENLIVKPAQSAELEPLFKAVAEAVAEAGPWEASMDMVAQRMGFSKSSLYCHFKNKRDMILKLFINEFTNIIKSARHGMSLSDEPVEQLYLGIYSIAFYLRSRPELLAAMAWVRTRKLDLSKSEKQFEVFRFFEDIKIAAMQNKTEEEKRRLSHWVLFLIILALMHDKSRKKQNDNIRFLFRFITSGLRGFTK